MAVCLALAVAACGGGGDDPEPSASPDTTEGGGSDAEGAITSIDDAEAGIVQIEAQGAFVDPEFGASEGAGRGSGFIIDPSGIAVTNNHVVTGAATVEVFVGGDTDVGRNARVLATSECSDLAVIDIEGDGYPFFEFFEGEVRPGLEIFLAGFPLGDPQYSLTSGIVQKAPATEETSWASVDSVIEHDAESNPGNSGGPLLTEDGEVVAVHYAGAPDTDQAFAIASPELDEVVAELREGNPVDYLGINGQAVVTEDGTLSGVWVSAVESGSPAQQIGLQGGDIITKMEGLSLATDGTMADYCDILRTQGSDAPLAIQALRFSTEEFLQGTVNQDSELSAASFAEDLETDTGSQGGPAAYADYGYVSDDSGQISVEIPVEWSDVDGTAFAPDEATSLPALRAAPDLAAFNANFSSAGMLLFASFDPADAADPTATLAQFLEGIGATAACPTSSTNAESYDDGLYTGAYSVLSDCDGTNAEAFGIVAVPADSSFAVFVLVQLVTDADFEALDRIIASFTVSP